MSQDLSPVSRTAIGVARIRAGESARDDRLFDDPYAARFVAAAPPFDAGEPTPERRALGARLAVHVVLRTRYYDDYLLAAVADSVRQVVLLAAGLDARALRLDWPDAVDVFEVDLPPVLAFKERALGDATASCRRVVVPADLTGDWVAALAAAGFDPTRPTAWLVEGLLIYLAAEQVAALLTAITDVSAVGSRLACERGGRMPTVAGVQTGDNVTELWQGGLDRPVDEWLAAHGWTVDVRPLTDVARDYGRPTSSESDSAFVSAERIAG